MGQTDKIMKQASPSISILPYTKVVGQDKLKLALELAYIAPYINGVLISGKRGTAKSTTVRAFARMMYGRLPVTIPINATEDRVVGGWQVGELMHARAKKQEGLLEEADQGLLYIDEVNLLDDHIVNIILDVTSTGILVIQREGLDEPAKEVSFTLVGTMNPEEGGLRPQLLDRFGLMAGVETEPEKRLQILETVLAFDKALAAQKESKETRFLLDGAEADQHRQEEINQAKDFFPEVELTPLVAQACVELANGFKVEGHRSDYLLALATRAYAALQGLNETSLEHLNAVAELVLRHRQHSTDQANSAKWDEKEKNLLAKLLKNVQYNAR